MPFEPEPIPPPPPGYEPVAEKDDVEKLVREAAQKYNVDPEHLVRMAKTESALKADTPDSVKGAIGPMQLMPGTAAELKVDPRDPRQNIEGGARYFKQLLDQFDGDYQKASAAYNAGPGRVTSGKTLPRETQNYLKSLVPPPPPGYTPVSNDATQPVSNDPDELYDPGDNRSPEAKEQSSQRTQKWLEDHPLSSLPKAPEGTLGQGDPRSEPVEPDEPVDPTVEGQPARGTAQTPPPPPPGYEPIGEETEKPASKVLPLETLNARIANVGKAFTYAQQQEQQLAEEEKQLALRNLPGPGQMVSQEILDEFKQRREAHQNLIDTIQKQAGDVDEEIKAYNRSLITKQAAGRLAVPGMEKLGGGRPGLPPIRMMRRETLTPGALTPGAPGSPEGPALHPGFGEGIKRPTGGAIGDPNGDIILDTAHGLVTGAQGVGKIAKALGPEPLPIALASGGVNMPLAAEGATQVIRGALEVGNPLLLAGYVEAPARTLAWLVGGAAASKGTEKGLEALGVRREYAELAGEVVGLATAGGGIKFILGRADKSISRHNEIADRLLAEERSRGLNQDRVDEIFHGESYPIRIGEQEGRLDYMGKGNWRVSDAGGKNLFAGKGSSVSQWMASNEVTTAGGEAPPATPDFADTPSARTVQQEQRIPGMRELRPDQTPSSPRTTRQVAGNDMEAAEAFAKEMGDRYRDITDMEKHLASGEDFDMHPHTMKATTPEQRAEMLRKNVATHREIYEREWKEFGREVGVPLASSIRQAVEQEHGQQTEGPPIVDKSGERMPVFGEEPEGREDLAAEAGGKEVPTKPEPVTDRGDLAGKAGGKPAEKPGAKETAGRPESRGEIPAAQVTTPDGTTVADNYKDGSYTPEEMADHAKFLREQVTEHPEDPYAYFWAASAEYLEQKAEQKTESPIAKETPAKETADSPKQEKEEQEPLTGKPASGSVEPEGAGKSAERTPPVAVEKLPEYAQRAIMEDSMMRRTNEGGSIDSPDPYRGVQWRKETVPIESLRPGNGMLWGQSSFQPRGSVTSGPIVVNDRGEIIDGNNRTYEAIRRGDKTIAVFQAVLPQTGSATAKEPAPKETEPTVPNKAQTTPPVADEESEVEPPETQAPPGPIPASHWMNEGEIEQALARHKNHPVLSKATKFLSDLREETNDHSDGWHSWPLPGHAAKQLMGIIQHPEYATEENYKKALAPIRAFYTKRGTAAGMKFPETGEVAPAKKQTFPKGHPLAAKEEKPTADLPTKELFGKWTAALQAMNEAKPGNKAAKDAKAAFAEAGRELMRRIFEDVKLPDPPPDLVINDESYYAPDSDMDEAEQAQGLYTESRAEQADRYANILLGRAALSVPNLPEKTRKAVASSANTTQASYGNAFIELGMAFSPEVADRMREEIETHVGFDRDETKPAKEETKSEGGETVATETAPKETAPQSQPKKEPIVEEPDDEGNQPAGRAETKAPPVSEPGGSGDRSGYGDRTQIRVPGESRTFEARYAVRELEDVIPSHHPVTLQANPKYRYRNDRNYSDPRNAERIIKQVAEFDPNYVVTESPDAVNGAPVIDKHGNVLGGNSRTMTIHRVYQSRPAAAQAYRELLARKAAQFGIKPEALASMRQPVLVRELTRELTNEEAQSAVTDLNKTGTAALTPSERAVADSNKVSPETLEQLAGMIENQGPEGTLAKALEGKAGVFILDRLVKDGVITTQEKPTLIDAQGNLTQTAKDRIAKLMLGRVFKDSEQYEAAPPALRNKLERIMAPLSRVAGKPEWDILPEVRDAVDMLEQARVAGKPEWDILPEVRDAVDMLEQARAAGSKNLDDLVAQTGLFGGGEFTGRTVAIAKALHGMGPVKLAQTFSRYANDSRGPTMFGEVTPAEAFAEAFDYTEPEGKPESQKSVKPGGSAAAAGLSPKDIVEALKKKMEAAQKKPPPSDTSTPFDEKAFDSREKAIADRVKESKATKRYEHLDQAPWGVEYLRGKTITSLRDGSTGVILTVTNHHDANVRWADEQSARNNSADPKVKPWVNALLAKDRDEFVLAPQAQVLADYPDLVERAKPPQKKPEAPAAKPPAAKPPAAKPPAGPPKALSAAEHNARAAKIRSAELYIKRLASFDKSAYARQYLSYLLGKSPPPEEQGEDMQRLYGDLSVMAKQAVRMELRKIMGEPAEPEVKVEAEGELGPSVNETRPHAEQKPSAHEVPHAFTVGEHVMVAAPDYSLGGNPKRQRPAVVTMLDLRRFPDAIRDGIRVRFDDDGTETTVHWGRVSAREATPPVEITTADMEKRFPIGSRVTFNGPGGVRQSGRVERIDNHGDQEPRFTLAVKNNGVIRHVDASHAELAAVQGPQIGDRVQINSHTGMSGRPEDFGVIENISTNGKSAVVKLDTGGERIVPMGDLSRSIAKATAPKKTAPQSQPKENIPGENPFASAADAERERLRAKFGKKDKPAPLQSRNPDAPAVDPEDLMGLATIGMEHMVNGATDYDEWTQRVMADVGDLVEAIADASDQAPEDVLREVHGYAAAAVKDFGHDIKPAPEKPPVKVEDKKPGGAPALIEAVYRKLKAGESLGNVTELNKLAELHLGGSRASGDWSPKDAFDAMEAGVNKLLIERGKALMGMDPIKGLAELRKLMEQITSQASVRTDEQIANQQFSTPPTESYVVARVAALKPTDVVLEPSAGNGGLAVWPKAIGATVHVNEISDRRAQMLEAVGFGKPTAHDGELINALLDPNVQPTVVLMNPPFSASTLKSHEAANRSQYGFNHVDQALQRLLPNGRLVVILGGGHANDTNGGATLSTGPSGKWFEKIAQLYNVRANIRIHGKEYQKYGTTFATRIIVIDKDGPTPSQVKKNAPKTWDSVLQGNVDTLEEAYNLLRDVAADRPQIEPAQDKPVPRGDRGPGERKPRPGLGADQGAGAAGGTGVQPGQPRSGTDREPADRPGDADGQHGKLETGGGDQLPGRVEPAHEPAGDSETAAAAGVEGSAAHADDERPSALPLEPNAEDPQPEAEADNGLFVAYRPAIAGPAHPGDIVETRTMATVPMPEITYRPSLPPSVLENGRLSAVQLEAIAIAGQQNAITLPNGSYASALIGDGTGVGKGRISAGILWDNYRQGRKRLIWVSEKWDLMQDAIRDIRGIGAHDLLRGITEQNGKNVLGANAAVQPFNKFGYGKKLDHDGVLFTTYALIRSEDKNGQRRVDQIEQYLRGDNDGEGAFILFDESHNLKNAVAGAGQESQIGRAVKDLLGRMPKLRTVSLSATAATDVSNLGYLDRLGLWGPGTAFPQGFGEFQSQVAPGGIAAMELIARELKAQGKYVSRTLSYKGVTYSTEKHELTPDQKELYRTAASAWASVVQAAEATISNTTNGGSRQKGRFMAAFGGAQQRFFGLLITALKTPTAIKLANEALAKDKSVVITLVNTNEAAQNREKSKLRDQEEGDEPPDFDFGPKEMLINLVRDNYPTQQYRDDVDSSGAPIKVPVYTTDAQGRQIPVPNPAAVAERDALIERIDRDLHMPENPLDILINSLGGEKKVAELTGRKEKFDTSLGKFVPRGDPKATQKEINLFEMRAFQGGKKRVAILSSAAGTGISLHAGNDVGNQQKRFHITLQVGWSADKAQQMLGRTHRTNQKQAPEYVFLVSDLAGEQRFVSTITRRLGSLGALTKGQKNAAAGSALGESANIETEQGRQATNAFYTSLLRDNPVPGTGLTGLQVLTDLRILKPGAGGLDVPPADRTNVTKLLNRLLALDPDVQNPTYAFFFDIFNAAVEQAIEQSTLDTGVKTLPGDEIEVKEQRPIGKDPKTGAETFYYPVDAKIRTDRVSPEELDERLVKNANRKPVIARTESAGLYLVMDAPPIVHADGRVEPASYTAKPDRGKWLKVPQSDLRRKGLQDVAAWAEAEVNKAQEQVKAAERSLERNRNEVAQGTKYKRDYLVSDARSGLRDAEAQMKEFERSADSYRADSQERQRTKLQGRIDEAQAELEKAQKYELPESDWRQKSVVSSEKELADLQEPLAQAKAIAKGPEKWAKDQWKDAYEKAPSHTVREHHLIGGAVMRFWNPIRDAVFVRNSIYTTSDSKSGQRVVGIDIPPTHIRALLDRITGGKSTVDTKQLHDDVLRNNMSYTLESNIQVRRGSVARTQVIQVIPPSEDVARHLVSLGVIRERGINPIYYVPSKYNGPDADRTQTILDRVLEMYPVKPDEAGSGPVQSRALPGDQPLFREDEEDASRASAKSHEDKLLGDQLTAQLRSGMAARPVKRKPATAPRGLFEDEAPEQHTLFSRQLRDSGGKGVFVDKGKLIDLGDDAHSLRSEKFRPGTLFGDSVQAMLKTGAVRGRGEDLELYEKALKGDNLLPAIEHAVNEARRKRLDDIGLEVHAAEGGTTHVRVPLSEIGEFLAHPSQYVRRYGQAGMTLFSRSLPGFYSQLERVIEQKMKGPAVPAQLLAMLKKPENGVKQDELKWSGIDTWLEERKGPVTKQQVLEFVRANNVQVEEVTKGGEDLYRTTARQRSEQLSAEWDAVNDRLRRPGPDTRRDLDRLQEIEAEQRRNIEVLTTLPADNTKFGQHVLPGGENYRELLLTLPEKHSALVTWSGPETHTYNLQAYGGGPRDTVQEWTASDGATIRTDPKRGFVINSTLVQNAAQPTLAKAMAFYQEQQHGAESRYRNRSQEVGNYRSSHWAEPNVLAHVRFNDRTWPNGEKILHVEEIQSDWHQEGKKKGYTPTEAETLALRDRADASNARWKRLSDDLVPLLEAAGLLGFDTHFQARNAIAAHEDWKTRWDVAPGSDLAKAGDQFREAMAEQYDVRHELGKIYKVPPAPFAKTWHELAFKRALRYAAENGYDQMTWTTGAQQADRYDLSKHVSSIWAKPTASGNFDLTVDGKDGETIYDTARTGPISVDKLEDTVGKEMTQKIVDRAAASGLDPIEFTGLDLKVGGEGMKGFYDQILPAFANKYAKKWGAKVGTTEIPTWNEDTELLNERELATIPKTAEKVHSIEITPSMRKSVMEGQPLFARKPKFNDPDQLSLFDQRSTSTAAIARPAGPRPPSAWTLDPESLRRLADAPSPAGAVATPKELQAFWEGTGARVADFGGKPALLVNIPGMEVVLRRMGPLGQGESSRHTMGLTLAPAEWGNVLDEARAEAGSSRFHDGFDEALIRTGKQIAKAMGVPFEKPAGAPRLNGAAEGREPLIVLQASERIPGHVLKRVAEEEYDHAKQMELPGGLAGLPAEIVDTPNGQVAAAGLARIGYPKLDPASPFYRRNRALIAAEIGVRLMRPDRWREMKLTAQQARDLTEQFIQGLAQHGDRAAGIVDQLYATREELEAALQEGSRGIQDPNEAAGEASPAKPRGPPEGTQRNVSGHQAVQTRGVSPDKPLGASEHTPAARGTALATPPRGASPIAPAGAPKQTARQSQNKEKRDPTQPDFYPRLRQTIVYPPAKGKTESVMTLHSRDANGEEEPKLHYSKAGAAQRLLLPGRNLAEVERASKEIFEAALPAASADAVTSTILMSAVPSIREALKGSPYRWDDLRQYYTESRLQGLRGRWLDYAQRVAQMTTEELMQAIQPLPDGSRSPFLDLLSKIQGRKGMAKDLAQTAIAMVEAKDWDGLKAFLAQAYGDAAARVTSIMDPVAFDDFRDAVANDPKVAEADRRYGDLVEKPMRDSHAVNEGVMSDALGPAGRYIPLTAAARPIVAGPGRRLPFHKPKNSANQFATGLSETYDTGMEPFAKKLGLSNRANYKAALLQTIQDAGWSASESDAYQTEDHGLGMTGPDGGEYRAERKEVSQARTIIKDGKVAHIPARFRVFPKFMLGGVNLILDRDPMDPNEVIAAMQWANMLSTKGPLELVYHGSGVLGSLYANTPFLGKSGLDKALSLPVVKWLGVRAKAWKVNPTTPENVAKLHKMAMAGALPAKSGKITYSKEHAETTGAKLERFSFGPMLYGPKGLDARARILAYDIFEAAYPNGTIAQLHHFINQLGNYTPEMQGPIERAVKHIGMGPFATAGMTRVVNSVEAYSGTGPGPGKTLESRLWWWLTASAWAALAAWFVAHKLLTGKDPIEDRRAKLFQIPVDGKGKGYIDQFRHSSLGNAFWGKGDETGYLNFGVFDNPLALRGARLGAATPFQIHQAGGSAAQMTDAAQLDLINTLIHPMMGPAARALFVGVTGEKLYMTGMRDRGKVNLRLFPGIPQDTRPGLPTMGAKAWAAAKELNSLGGEGLEGVATATGLVAEDERSKGNWLMKTLVNLALPGVVGNATDPLNRAEALARERSAVKDAEKIKVKREITQAVRDHDKAKTRELVQKGVKAGILTQSDVLQSVKRANVPKDIAGFRALSVEGALDIMEIATPEEKRRFLPSMADKIRNGAGRMTVLELKEAVDRYKQATQPH